MMMTEWITLEEESRNEVAEIDFSCHCGDGYDEPCEGWDAFLHEQGEELAAALRENFPNATVNVELALGASRDYAVYGQLQNGRTVLIIHDPFTDILKW